LPLSGKFRGAVLLAPGTYTISKTINVWASGVVIRGSREGNEIKSKVYLKGKPFNAITLRAASGNQRSVSEVTGQGIGTALTDSYVPSGSMEITVADASKFARGDMIQIQKPVTTEWIEFMQMHNLVRDGKPQTWISLNSKLITERQIVKISGNRIILDVPLSDSFDSHFFSN